MSEMTPSQRYAAGVQRGDWRADPAQRAALAELDRIHEALVDGEQDGWLDRLSAFWKKTRTGTWPVCLGRCRARQDLSGRSVLRRPADQAEIPHAFPPFHARRARAVARACRAKRSAGQNRPAVARESARAGAGRILRHRYRRCDVAGAPARTPVRRRRHAGDHIQYRAAKISTPTDCSATASCQRSRCYRSSAWSSMQKAPRITACAH